MTIKTGKIKLPSFKLKFPSAKKIFKLLIIFILVCFLYSFIEPYLIEEKRTVIRDSDIPESLDGTKIVFVSDIHHDQYFSRVRIADIVNRINSQNPDIIILGGDYVYGDKKYIAPCFEELAKLKAQMGIYAVTGNHDSWTDYDQTIEAMQKAGIVPLENKARWLGSGFDKIKLGGVATSFEKKSDIRPTVEDASESDFVILAAHNPDIAEEIKTNEIDLVLAGHNHGGQVTFFGLWAPYIPSDYGAKYLKGTVKTPYTTVLISNGVGNSFLPIRFFARPQINIIVLKKQ